MTAIIAAFAVIGVFATGALLCWVLAGLWSKAFPG